MVAVQPGGVQAAAAQSGVGLGSYPGKSVLKKGNDTHHLKIDFYVNFLGRFGSNRFQLK